MTSEQLIEELIDNFDTFISCAYEGYSVDYTVLRAFLSERLALLCATERRQAMDQLAADEASQ